MKERLARQQDILRRRLGLVSGVDSDMDILLDDEDILPAHAASEKSLQKQKSKDGQVWKLHLEIKKNSRPEMNIMVSRKL